MRVTAKMRIKNPSVAAMAVLYLASSVWSQQPISEPLGLSVGNGVLTRGGRPYRGIGGNYDHLFYRRLLRQPE